MAKSKNNKKSQPTQIYVRIKRVRLIVFVLLALVLGYFIGKINKQPTHPESLIWAVQKDLKVPPDLVSYLETQQNCKDSEGKPREDTVNLWSVVNVSQNKIAKLAYGCSYDLSFYKIAIKQDKKWKLLDPTTYMATSFLPKCAEVEMYKIDKTIEPFCFDVSTGSRENKIVAE